MLLWSQHAVAPQQQTLLASPEQGTARLVWGQVDCATHLKRRDLAGAERSGILKIAV